MLFAVLLPVLVVLFLLAMERFEAWVVGPPDHDAGVPQGFREPRPHGGRIRWGRTRRRRLDSRATNAANSSRAEGTFGHSVRV